MTYNDPYLKAMQLDENDLIKKAEPKQVKAKDFISNYGSDYGITPDQIGWHREDPNTAGTVTLGGYDLGNLSSIDNQNSGWASEDMLKSAIDNYANQRGLTKKSEANKISNFGYEPDKYSSKIDAMLNSIMFGPKFSYNPETDQSYQALKSQYGQLGDNALKNTMSAASGLTGGRLNSWAVSAGNQAKSNFDDQLTSFIPQLESAAYNRFSNDLNNKKDALNTLIASDNNLYDRAMNERSFSYGANRDNIADNRYNDETAYNKSIDQRNYDYQLNRDSISDNRYKDETAYNRDFAEKQFNYSISQDAIQNAQRWSGISLDKEKFNYQKEQDKIQNEIDKAAAENKIDAETLGAIYNGMFTAEDPSQWLKENSKYMTNDEIQAAIKFLPKGESSLDQALAQILGNQ